MFQDRRYHISPTLSNGIVIPDPSEVVCYEGIFGDDMCRYCRQGAEIFFISVSNEIVDNMHCEKQMLNISRANAITTDRSIVRAVQNGLSYAVDNRGRVLAFCDNADSMVVQNVELTSKQTFYTKHYRRIEYFYGFLFIGGIGWCMTAAGKSEKTGPSDFSKGLRGRIVGRSVGSY
ncbi:nitrilase-related carbon-nitrogen hydrolase [Rikenella microfusus]